MNKEEPIKTLMSIDGEVGLTLSPEAEKPRASALSLRRYREMVSAYEELRERCGR